VSRPRRLLMLVVCSALACGTVSTAFGQDSDDGEADPEARGSARGEAAIFDDVEGEELDQDVEGEVRTEGGNKVKVFRFSGLDLAGRLKSPQLLYFLNRMRAEFDRPRLPHRSFIPELQRSAQGKAFR